MIPLTEPPPSSAAHAPATAGPSTGCAVTWSSPYPNGRGPPRNRRPLVAACSLASFCRSALRSCSALATAIRIRAASRPESVPRSIVPSASANRTLNGRKVRGTIAPGGRGWVFTVTPMWMCHTGVMVGDDVTVELAPEGPQRDDLADDFSAALAANPAAAAFYDTLAQFYRKAYLRWIDATIRRPELRPERIAEVVDLLAAGLKQRPRS